MAAQLILDASSSMTQVGIWEDGSWLAFESSTEHALESLFSCVAGCLDEAGLTLKDIGGIIYCEGPGSILGIRLVAMAIRIWKVLPELESIPVYAYQSFAFAALAIKYEHKLETICVISPFRNQLWNLFEGDLFRETNEDELKTLPAKDMWLVPQRRMAKECPIAANVFDYHLKEYPEVFLAKGLYSERAVIDAIHTGDKQFVKWTGERHQ